MPRLISVNTSPAKGTAKRPVPSAALDRRGLVGDAHAGAWHRQVSLLAVEDVRRFAEASGVDCPPGAFAENLTTEALDLSGVGLRDVLLVGPARLEVTQVGKACHGPGCAIRQQAGDCLMPRAGVFARVLEGGEVRPGDPVEHRPRPLRVRVVTLSDRASRGEYLDTGGPRIRARVEALFAGTRWRPDCSAALIPDDADRLRALVSAAAADGVDALFTTGGTGLGPRDITPETLRPLLDREIPGLMEAVRVACGARHPAALLSRSLAGQLGPMLVYALPGSLRAVDEYCDVILPTLEHAVLMAAGIDAH